MSYKFNEIKAKVQDLMEEKDSFLTEDEFRLAVVYLLRKILEKP